LLSVAPLGLYRQTSKNLLRVTDKLDSHLFFNSITIQLVDGKNTPFWEARWLQGSTPKELAPNLYDLARFKYRNVHTELSNLNWIRNLMEISSEVELEEFTMLFMALSSIFLTEEKDEITWKWTSSGKFSVASAYNCQLHGAMSSFPAPAIWKATVEPRSKFFSWLVLHNRVLTVDTILKKNWSCNPICPLYFYLEETTFHILAECNFIEAAWNLTASTFNLPSFQTIAPFGGPAQWLDHL
jgi:hypothetical protein